ncbi:unnamed protein product, partial [Laminaria digitata]
MQGRRCCGRVCLVWLLQKCMGCLGNDLNNSGTKVGGPKLPGVWPVGQVLTRQCRGVRSNMTLLALSGRKCSGRVPMLNKGKLRSSWLTPTPECPCLFYFSVR